MQQILTERNQAVVFTKPLHHLHLPFSCQELNAFTADFLDHHKLHIIKTCVVTGAELAAHQRIPQHYYMYSKASYVAHPSELQLSTEALQTFQAAFGSSWETELQAGRIQGNPILLKQLNLSPAELSDRWNQQSIAKAVHKLQPGLLITWLPELGHYCINGFYPRLEAIFNHPSTRITYYVIEFDPAEVSWKTFRKDFLGATHAAKAAPHSLRGELYHRYGNLMDHPERDNFVHGSAGPFEGFIERTIHEPDFSLAHNPIGRMLAEKGIPLAQFQQWKAAQSLAHLGALYDATEEVDTPAALSYLCEVFDKIKH